MIKIDLMFCLTLCGLQTLQSLCRAYWGIWFSNKIAWKQIIIFRSTCSRIHCEGKFEFWKVKWPMLICAQFDFGKFVDNDENSVILWSFMNCEKDVSEILLTWLVVGLCFLWGTFSAFQIADDNNGCYW